MHRNISLVRHRRILPTCSSDIYTLEIARLDSIEDDRAFRIATFNAWQFDEEHAHLFDSCSLFRNYNYEYLDLDVHEETLEAMRAAGHNLEARCAIDIKRKVAPAATPKLTQLVRNHRAIPRDPNRISRGSLKAFADIMRITDELLGRKPPRSTQVRPDIADVYLRRYPGFDAHRGSDPEPKKTARISKHEFANA